MTPPDSGEREFQCEACPRAFSSAPALAVHERRWHGATQAEMEVREDGVSLPLSLAQRILAALEDPGLRQTYGFVTKALADELRAIVERKPDTRKEPQ